MCKQHIATLCISIIAFSCACCADDNDYELSRQSVLFPASVNREASETLKFQARCDHQTEGNENAVLTIKTQDARVVTGNPASTEVVILGKGSLHHCCVPLSSNVINVPADRNHLQTTSIVTS